MKGRVLVVAGSDSGGGAGIQADIKAITAMGAFAATAITALTAQNTVGVHGVHPIPADFVARQMRVVLTDIGADCIKIGMLSSAAIIAAVADELAATAPDVPVVLDPVMVAKGGAALLDADAQHALIEHLLPRAALVTPNVPEATALTGIAIADVDDQRAAGRALLDRGAAAALIKGGHLTGDQVTDLLLTAGGPKKGGETVWQSPRLASRNTHGTGCTLASAVAAGVAQGLDLPAAVTRARAYVQAAIAAAPGYGAGHGPMDHGVWIPSDHR